MDEYAQTTRRASASPRSPGVAQVQVFGSQKYAVRVQVDPLALAARGIGIDEVEHRHRSRQQQPAHRHARRPDADLHRRDQRPAEGRRGLSARSSSPIATARRCGSSEVASVLDSVENDRVASWFGDTRAIVLAVQRQPGANTVEVVDAIKALLPADPRAAARRRCSSKILIDRSETIRESVHDVQFTLLLSIALVVLVIFLFLRTRRAPRSSRASPSRSRSSAPSR